MEGEVEGLVSRELDESYARNYDDRRKHGMICGVNVSVFCLPLVSFPFLFEN